MGGASFYIFNFLFNITLRGNSNSTSFLRLYFILWNIFFFSSEMLSCDLQNYISDPATRIDTTRAPASALSRPSSGAAKAPDPLCTRAKSISLWPHNVGRGRKKNPAHGGGIQRGPEFRISSQSACCVNTDWTRPGVARSRLRPIYRLFAVSSLSGARERPRCRRWFLGDPGSWCWWSVANPAPGSDSNDSRMVPSWTTLFWDFPWVPNSRWSRRSVEGIVRNRTPCSVTVWVPEGERSREDPSISRVFESLRWLGEFFETNTGYEDFGLFPITWRYNCSSNYCRSLRMSNLYGSRLTFKNGKHLRPV